MHMHENVYQALFPSLLWDDPIWCDLKRPVIVIASHLTSSADGHPVGQVFWHISIPMEVPILHVKARGFACMQVKDHIISA